MDKIMDGRLPRKVSESKDWACETRNSSRRSLGYIANKSYKASYIFDNSMY